MSVLKGEYEIKCLTWFQLFYRKSSMYRKQKGNILNIKSGYKNVMFALGI